MKKTALLIFSILLASAALNAQQKMKQGGNDSKDCPMAEKGMRKNNPGCMPPFFLESEEIKKELSLTDEQVAKIKTLNSNFKKQAESIHDKQKKLHYEMRKLDQDDNSNISDYEKLINEMSANGTEMQLLHAKHKIEIRSILTKDQKDKIKKNHESMRGKEKHRRHRDDDSEN